MRLGAAYSEVEGLVGGHGGVHHVATCGVRHSLGLASGTGGVQDEEGVLAVHCLAGAVGAGLCGCRSEVRTLVKQCVSHRE